MNQITEKGDIIKQIGPKYGANTKVRQSLFCSALEQKVSILLKNQRKLGKSVVNQINEKENIIKQIGPNRMLTPV